MDRLDAMSVLLAAVDGGSLSHASRQLRLPLATVSRKVADLEAYLKASLLIRSSKGLELTPAGRAYVTAAKAILEQVGEAERAAAGEYVEPRGDLVVTAPTMLGRLHALPVVLDFLAAFPEVSVSLMLTDRVTHFLDDQVDLALRVGAMPDSDLIASRVGAIRRVVCASPAYLAASGAPQTPADLARHGVIAFGSVSETQVWPFWSDGQEIAAAFRARLSVSTIEAAIDAAVAGAGLVRAMSYQVADHVQAGRLMPVLEAYEPTPPPVQLVYGRQIRLPLKLRAFVDFATPRLRGRLEAATI